MKLSILVGRSQGVYAAITAFNSFEDGLKWLKDRFPTIPFEEVVVGTRRKTSASLYKYFSEDEIRKIADDHFFTSYYDGCGGIDALILLEIEPGEKLFPFSLD